MPTVAPRQLVDQLDLVRLVGSRKCASASARGHSLAHEGVVGARSLSRMRRFDGGEVVGRERAGQLEVVVEAVLDGGADGEARAGEERRTASAMTWAAECRMRCSGVYVSDWMSLSAMDGLDISACLPSGRRRIQPQRTQRGREGSAETSPPTPPRRGEGSQAVGPGRRGRAVGRTRRGRGLLGSGHARGALAMGRSGLHMGSWEGRWGSPSPVPSPVATGEGKQDREVRGQEPMGNFGGRAELNAASDHGHWDCPPGGGGFRRRWVLGMARRTGLGMVRRWRPSTGTVTS